MGLFKELYIVCLYLTTAEHWTILYPHVQRQAWRWDRQLRLSLFVVDSIAMQSFDLNQQSFHSPTI